MAKFNHRKGEERNVRSFTVRLFDNANGKELYSRVMETGVIKNMPNYLRTVLEGLVMVDKYRDCGFGDLDMVCEVNGHMLNIEFKGDFNKLLKSKGQLIQAVNLAKTSKVTTLFVEGNPDNPQRIFSVSHVLTFNDYKIKQVNGIDGLNVYISEWEQYAKRQKRVNTYEEIGELAGALEAQLNGTKPQQQVNEMTATIGEMLKSTSLLKKESGINVN